MTLASQEVEVAGVFTPESNVVAEYQGATIKRIYTPVWLHRVSEEYRLQHGYKGPDFTLGTVPDAVWDDLAKRYDGVYFLTIFQRGQMGRNHALIYADQYTGAAPNENDGDSQGKYEPQRDVISSGFPHLGYENIDSLVAPGNWSEFDEVVGQKLHARGMKVGVDFVGHIVAMDHPLVGVNREFFVTGTPEQFNANPKGYIKQPYHYTDENGQVHTYYIAHGNDKHYGSIPWTDSAKVNLANPQVQQMITDEAVRLVKQHNIDFLRLDMAHLSTADNFPRTCPSPLDQLSQKDLARQELWDIFPGQVHDAAKTQGRHVALIAEAYDHEDHLLARGIDLVYGHMDYYRLQQQVSFGEVSPRQQADYLKFNPRRRQVIHYQETHDGKRAADVEGLGSWENAKIQATISAFRKDGPWVVYDGQEYGDVMQPPMQLRRVRTMRTSDGAYIDRLLLFRQTNFFKQAEYFLPPHYPEGDDTYQDLIIQQLETENEGAVACTNPTSYRKRKCLVRLPKNATNIRVIDLDTWETVSPIASPFQRQEDLTHVYLSVTIHGPKQGQLILYDKK